MIYESYRKNVKFINGYKQAHNAATGSKFDSNANVENKNIATMSGELPKEDLIGTNRLLMVDALNKMNRPDMAEEYIRQLEAHEIYKHDETSLRPYCCSITMYPYLFFGLKQLGGMSAAPTHMNSFAGSFINLVFAIASQFAGAVSTPEFLTYLDYYIRLDYGNDYIDHINDVVDLSNRHCTLDKKITDIFQQVVHSINQPAAARDYQSVFWNIAYFDSFYFKGIFGDFEFPDGTIPNWTTVSWLQKRFMVWLNNERLNESLTFPVETVNLLDDGEKYLDTEWAAFVAKMWSKGHSFFLYRSNNIDSLASCCFDGQQQTLTKSTKGVNLMSFKELYEASYKLHKRNFKIFHNGSWVQGNVIKLPKRDLYKVTTANNKTIFVTDNHIHPTLTKDKITTELTLDDYLLFNNRELETFPEQDKKLSYEQGILIGMYLGDGSMYQKKEEYTPQINLSLNQVKYESSFEMLKTAVNQITNSTDAIKVTLNTPYNNVFPVMICNKAVRDFIREYVSGNYCNDKQLNMDCLFQSKKFRQGIMDGYYLTDGGNSNRIYTTSKELVCQIEALMVSLGLNTIIDITDRTDEKVVIREQEYNRNFPLYCIRWYDSKNKRSMGDVYIVRNNSIYFKIKQIEKVESNEEFVYCFEMENKEEPYFTLPNGIITHNCRLRNEISDTAFSFTLGAGGVSTGSKGVITINMNRLVQNAVKNNQDISEAVREQVKKVHTYLEAYNSIILDYEAAKLLPAYDAGFISMKKQFLTIGISGFIEGAEFLGIDISPNDKYFQYGESILKPIYEENRKARTTNMMFNTEYVPAENLGSKNAKWDAKDNYVVPRDCYNSYFYKVEDTTTNIIDKFILHGNKLTQYLDGGSALHVNLEEHLTEAQYRHLMDVAIKTGCSYFTFNIPNTICNSCGHIHKKYISTCEKCGSTDVDYITRIIGYLKRISKWSLPRQIEGAKRHYASSKELD